MGTYRTGRYGRLKLIKMLINMEHDDFKKLENRINQLETQQFWHNIIIIVLIWLRLIL